MRVGREKGPAFTAHVISLCDRGCQYCQNTIPIFATASTLLIRREAFSDVAS